MGGRWKAIPIPNHEVDREHAISLFHYKPEAQASESYFYDIILRSGLPKRFTRLRFGLVNSNSLAAGMGGRWKAIPIPNHEVDREHAISLFHYKPEAQASESYFYDIT